jgi:ribosome-binding factor A
MVFKEKSQKQLQVGEQVKRELASIFLHGDVLDSSKFKLTVCEADMSPDLKNAKIFINIFGEVDKEKLVSELNRNNYYFRKAISKSLKLRSAPQIKFILDSASDNAVKISKALEKEGDNI